MDSNAHRLLRTWADNAVAQGEALGQIDPSWGSECQPIADGWLVLWGRGMYVNRAMGLGIDAEIEPSDLERIISTCRAAGIPPAVEVTPLTLESTVETLVSAGFTHDAGADITALVRPVPGAVIETTGEIIVRSVTSERDLQVWQETSAAGWGHVTPDARRTSDAFTRAAHVTDGEGMLLAFGPDGTEAMGCASMTIRNGIATVGGMSTLPNHRRRGVQAAFLAHRLQRANDMGCDMAATSTAAGSASERNLVRHGFDPIFTIETWVGT